VAGAVSAADALGVRAASGAAAWAISACARPTAASATPATVATFAATRIPRVLACARVIVFATVRVDDLFCIASFLQQASAGLEQGSFRVDRSRVWTSNGSTSCEPFAPGLRTGVRRCAGTREIPGARDGTFTAGGGGVMTWEALQLAAIFVGLGLVVRELGLRAAPPFAFAVLLAAIGGLLLGSAGPLVRWALAGARAAPPDLEVAGFGALAGLVVGFVVAARSCEIGGRQAESAIAPAIGAMIACSRIGCFVAGCDFGAPTTLPWAVRYGAGTPAFRAQVDAGLLDASARVSLPVHPTQLYEVALGVLLFLLAPRLRGNRLLFAIVAYAIGRACIDTVRGDLGRGALGLTASQWLAFTTLAAAIAWTSHRRARRAAEAESA
jgi:prolipoprotein diacylglyceryl transferase